MTPSRQTTDLLKVVLANLSTPERLDNHPWTKSLFVREICSQDPRWQGQPAGIQLAAAIGSMFRRMRPSAPPRRGLRLDTRWGEFGLLASRYFAPYLYGLPYPSSLREAWQGIDNAILLFLNDGEDKLSEEERSQYCLIANEPVVAANSTISDWHRKGIQTLAELVMQEETRLGGQVAAQASETESAVVTERPPQPRFPRRRIWRWIGRIALALLVLFLAFTGWKSWQIYQTLRSIQTHAQALLSLTTSLPDPAQLGGAGEHLSNLRSEMQLLEEQAQPFLAVAPHLGWVPVYGGDLSQAPLLLDMGIQLSVTGDEAFQAVSPLLPAVVEHQSSSQILKLLGKLDDAQLLAAQAALSRARAAREQIQDERLSAKVRDLLVGKVDPLLISMEGSFPADDVLLMARLSPRLLGAAGNGPQTYLLLIQNEDELRPTGGFLSAVGLLELKNGEITKLTFETSELPDDLSKPYPKAPWQLDEYMQADILLLRDANWFTNFPTTVDWVKFLYAYSRPASINGVIAIDQHVLIEILGIVGPVSVQGEKELISQQNVLSYMRLAEEPPPEGADALKWDRKRFIGRLSAPLVKKLLSGEGYSSADLVRKVLQLIEEKHILLQSDDPEMMSLLTRRGWDGIVRPHQNRDFLMAVDANIGFNKTNAVTDKSLIYGIDLRDVSQPRAKLSVMYVNHARGSQICFQNQYSMGLTREAYNIDDCYWTYLRIYSPAGTELTGATPQAVQAGRTLLGEPVPAHVDQLGNEDISGIQVFGALVVVPMEARQNIDFQLSLPAGVVQRDPETQGWTYHLTVQKQPGTLAVPITLRLFLPQGMEVTKASQALQQEQGIWTLETDLRTDLDFEVSFAPSEK